MASQAVYCLSLQLRPPNNEENAEASGQQGGGSKLEKKSDNSNTHTTVEMSGRPQMQAQHAAAAQQQTHSNFILVRAARSENGQIILQNSHELLSLLSEDDKPILLQQQRLKTKTEHVQQHHQTTIKSTGSMDGTILLQSTGMKKSAMQAPEGSIILQQRMPKNGSNDGPILLQTLKRLDKSQSILLIRNTPTTATVTTAQAASGGGASAAAGSSSGASSSHSKNNAPVAMIEDTDDRPVEPPPPQKQKNIPLGLDGEPIKLPDNLESLPRADHFPTQRHRWNTNEEIAAILISFDKHSEWQSKEVKTRPKSGSMLLYSRKKVRYRRDGYCWKKRKDGKTTREDHMKLKVQGTECIYGCYVHSAILPTFHRRCYWLLQNPDIVLVHYLNVPYPDDNKMAVITPSLALWGDKKEWTKEELVSQLKPMFFSEDETDASNEIEISTAETVEAIVGQLMEKQRLARQAALVKQLECGCPDSTCADGKSCSHPMRRISSSKPENKRQDNSNQVSSTTPNVLVSSRFFPRWNERERRGREGHVEGGLRTTKTLDGSSIHFQVIPTTSQSHTSITTNQNSIIRSSNNNLSHLNSNSNYSNTNSHLSTNNHNLSSQSNANLTTTMSTGRSATTINGVNSQIFLANHLNNNANSTDTSVNDNNNQLATVVGHSNNNNNNNNNNGGGGGGTSGGDHDGHNLPMITNQNTSGNSQQQSQQQQHLHQNHQQQQQQQQQALDNNLINGHGRATNLLNNQNQIINNNNNTNTNNNNNRISVNSNNNNNNNSSSNSNNNTVSSAPIVTSAPPLVLSLSQINGTSGSLFILNGQQQSFVCQQSQQQQMQQPQQQLQQQQQQQQQLQIRKQEKDIKKQHNNQTPSQQQPPTMLSNLVPKLEAMDSSNTSSSMSSTVVDKHYQDFIHNDMNFSSTRQNTPTNSPSKDGAGLGMKDPHDTLHFFNETLDLSQEDIQRTLSANMPLGGHTADDAMNGEINPMDFIENCHSGGADDDVFVNLDAFDMLVEFPELELDPKSSFLHASDNDDSYKPGDNLSALHNDLPLTQTEMSTITDYSPEWAYPEGGVKVLVTGPWTSAATYTALFDSFPVPTTLVQNGVLRCYCPAHEVGVANLQVASDGYVISNSVNFEYKSPPKVETKVEGSSNDAMYKFSLLNRLETIDEKLQIKSEPTDFAEDSVLFNQPNFEDRLVNYCQTLIAKTWRSMTPGAWTIGHRGMTLLHLASALGYSRLVNAMLKWRTENSSLILEAEIDALSQDVDGYTPLMWACARGHKDTALLLYKWNYNALNVKNVHQFNCLDLAKHNGFKSLAADLERVDRHRQEKQKQSNHTISMTNQLHLYNTTFSSSSSFQSSTTTTSMATSKDQLIGKNLENSGYGQLEGLTLSHCSSPSSILGDRSHDGVFLRPGAVSASGQSPPGARLSKRPSIDSGINMDSRASSTRSGKGYKDNHRFFKMDRSMSLPTTNSPQTLSGMDHLDNFSLSIDRNNDSNLGSNNTSNMTSNNSLLSPLRKMDFALCEVSTGNSSPIDEQQERTIEEEDSNQDDLGDNNTGGGVVGESDAKVLTLAEQIIAAMPDRIKNESEEMSLGSPLQESLTNDASSMAMLNDSFMEPLLDSLPSSQFEHEFSFEFSDQHYRYHDVGTPCSSLSPASSGPLQSPASYSVAPDTSIGSPSPPPTTEDFTEFLQASNSAPRPFEADFSNLTLTDREQRELYEAAKCIQKAYRSYKGRQKLEEQDKERSAAVLIQNYYRRYKQYAYYRQMTAAALVIQNGYRSYCENKRFKKSQTTDSCASSAAVGGDTSSQCIQNYYRSLQHQHSSMSGGSSSKEASPSGPLKRTYSQRTQNQAARKIQQFMRQSKNKLQKERAERERQALQLKVACHQNLSCQGHPEGQHINDPRNEQS